MLNPISKLISKIQIDSAETQKSKTKEEPYWNNIQKVPNKDQKSTELAQKSQARTKKLGYLVTLYMMNEAESPEEYLEQRVEESHTEHEQQGVGEVWWQMWSRDVWRLKINFLGDGPHIRMQEPPLTGLVGLELG